MGRVILLLFLGTWFWIGATARADDAGLPPPVVLDPATGERSGESAAPASSSPAAARPVSVPRTHRAVPAEYRPRTYVSRPVVRMDSRPPATTRYRAAYRPTVANPPRSPSVPARSAVREPGPDPHQIARGPFEVRDDFLLAQPRLTLPATSPDSLGCGRWKITLHHDWGNDFGYSQTGPPEDPSADIRFQVDGEHRTFEVGALYGLGAQVDVGIRVPVHWRGGGYMDGLIDWWHERWGLGGNGREQFLQDQFRVRGRDAQGRQYSWFQTGWGLGNVELNGRWEFIQPGGRRGVRAALVGRATFPTATGPFVTDSFDVGLQAVGAIQLWRRFDLYGGLGGTWFSEDTIQGIQYEPLRGSGFLALEWRPFSFMSFIVQSDASTRLVTNLVDYPDVQWYLQAGVKFDLGRGVRLTGGMSENLMSLQSTVDVGIWGSLEFTL